MNGRDELTPEPINGSESVEALLNKAFLAYNAARLREGCRLLAEQVQDPEVTVVWTISGALTPAGLGTSCLAPLMEAGWIDWLVSTGANLYHDLHYALGLPLIHGIPSLDDRELKEQGYVRIYDILMRYEVLLSTDDFVRSSIHKSLAQNGLLTTPELHYVLGKATRRERGKSTLPYPTLLETAADLSIPIFCPAPGDSSIGMNLAALSMLKSAPIVDIAGDVNFSSAIVWQAKKVGGKSAVVIVGGGAPKNFALQTEPHLQEILGLDQAGHDILVQITDARPDTGGLSGATPSEAMTWGKVDPLQLESTIVVYLDATVALPLLTSYLLATAKRRDQKRLLEQKERLLSDLEQAAREEGKRSENW
jgi:deoxyhypusine synthase